MIPKISRKLWIQKNCIEVLFDRNTKSYTKKVASFIETTF